MDMRSLLQAAVGRIIGYFNNRRIAFLLSPILAAGLSCRRIITLRVLNIDGVGKSVGKSATHKSWATWAVWLMPT
jgi:hypothetical protein